MNLHSLGSAAVGLCFVLSVYSSLCSFAGARLNRPRLTESARNGIVAVFFLLVAATGLLLGELASLNFELKYVAMNTSSDLPFIYRITALWAGQSGSLMLWCLILAAYSAVFVLRGGDPSPGLRAVRPYATGVLSCVLTFFIFLIAFVEDPFELLPFAPQEGRGLNPILQNPYMAVHPLALYVGYVGITVPYAFGMGALLSGRVDSLWVNRSRRWALFSWGFLSLGLLLGARWAYMELGWGGYWAWDPVENAAFMPWLSGTALLHSMMVQKRRGMFMKWNIVLLTITFFLSILGTFITRSGILSSVHSFARSDIGPMFALFMAVILIFSSGAYIFRRHAFTDEGGGGFDSALSRESAFVFNNVLFLIATFIVFLGTVFPILSESVTGTRALVGPPYFNRFAPGWLVLIMLMGIGPLLQWRKTAVRPFARALSVPLLCAFATAAALAASGLGDVMAVAAFSICVFSSVSAVAEFFKGSELLRLRGRSSGFFALLAADSKRYGGYVAHVGVALIAAGVTASSVFPEKRETLMTPGETVAVGGYDIGYESVERRSTAAKDIVSARFAVVKNGKPVGRLVAEKNRYLYEGNREINRETEVGLLSSWKDDLYVVLLEANPDRSVLMMIVVNPMVSWIWAGGAVIFLGAAMAFSGTRRRRGI